MSDTSKSWDNIKMMFRMKPFFIPVPGWGTMAVDNIGIPSRKKGKKGSTFSIKPPSDASELYVQVVATEDGKFVSNWSRPNSQNSIDVGAKAKGTIGIFVYIRFKRQTGGRFETRKNPNASLNPFKGQPIFKEVFVPTFDDYDFRFEQIWEIERSDGEIIVTRPELIGPEGKKHLIRLAAGQPFVHTWLDYARKSQKPYVKISFKLMGPEKAIIKKPEVRVGNFTLNLNAAVLTPIRVPKDLKHIVYFEYNHKHADRPQLRDLENWVDALKRESPPLYRAIRSKECPIRLAGYASTPATKKYNRRLAEDRMSSVVEALKDQFGTDARVDFKRTNYGEIAKRQTGKVPREQRVEVEIKENDAART